METDLTNRAPRSPRVRLGGYAHLPRLIDKARASVAGKMGVYVFGDDSLLDQEFFKFTGIEAERFLEKVATGAGDWELLQWVKAESPRSLASFQIEAWSHWIETVPGLSIEARAWFAEFASELDPPRADVSTLFEYLDVDDYVRFGGRV